MNAEHLLDAIGQLDDDLVQAAEHYHRPKARYGQLLGWAASFAVVLLLGYWVTHLGLGGGNSAAPENAGGAPMEGYSGTSAPSAAEDGNPSQLPDLDTPLESPSGSNGLPESGDANAEAPGVSGDVQEPEQPGEPFWISVRLDVDHNYSCIFGEPKILDELPEGCVELGTLEFFWPGTKEPNVPYTASEEYVGCPVWLLVEENPQAIHFYVGLPEGGYLTNR